MANQFLINDYFNDRHTNLDDMMSRYRVDDLPNVIVGLENIGERHRENRWQNTMDTIIACVALKRQCGGQVGRWLQNNRVANETVRARITEKCKWSAAIFRDWENIVHFLSERDMGSVDPRDYTLRNLYDVRGDSWRNET